jgi:FdrA protein
VVERVSVRRRSYRDSVALMLASRDAAAVAGVAEATAVCATPLNVDLLARSGFDLTDAAPLEPADLVVAVRADSGRAADEAIAAIEARLAAAEPPSTDAMAPPPRSLTAAARRRDDANLAVISVPGGSAAYECAAAIDAGLNVFCFSSGFDAALERELKRSAIARGLLMMGPDCGTAIVDGVGIGFANELERGPVGIVGASGTGMQQVACLLDLAGIGISQAIGVGGRDLGPEVGGAMALRGVELLAADPATETVVVIAKSPAAAVADRVAAAAAAGGKPAVLCFPCLAGLGTPPGVETAATLEQAARAAAERSGGSLELPDAAAPGVRPGLIRGLFSGGTLRDEALSVLAAALAGAGAEPPLAIDQEPRGEGGGRHLLIDYGSESLTVGRAHPMIDPSLRNAAVEREGRDPDVSVVLLDVVLGRAAHPDPAAELAPAIESLLSARAGDVAVVVSLCGSRRDSQGLGGQAARLRDAGATVALGNAQAARLAVAAATGAVHTEALP